MMEDTMSSLKDSATNCSVSFTNDSRNMNLEEDERTPSPPLRRRADGSFIQVLRRLSSMESVITASDQLSPRQNILRPHPTFDSNTSSEDSNSPSRKVHRKQATKSPSPKPLQRDVASPSPSSSSNNNNADLSRFSQHSKADDQDDDYESTILSILYIALFSVFGAVLRIYIARFFGLDCEFSFAAGGEYVNDFLTPFASHICVTASGKTEQTGGALFTDLPANMLGSFLVGLLTPTVQAHRLPWFRPDHPLQHHIPFITALRVGFCGSLTTFASWNTQMIVMLDGTDTELGPQVASAIVGYLIGISCAVSAFVMGRHMHDWLRAQHGIVERESDPEDGREEFPRPPEHMYQRGWRQATSAWEHAMEIFGIRLGPLLLFCGLLTAFLVADIVQRIAFYRKMWMIAILAPVGALVRWKLSEWNTKTTSSHTWDWLPRGTLAANLLASILSVLMRALDYRLSYNSVGSDIYHPLLLAIETGLSGSLSTVSSMVAEMFGRETPAQAHAYYCITILSSMLLGLAVYCPIVRSA